ncbi:B12-binding domain-containing radical SAM protein [Fulvivirga ligni]|uniref:B12-binding domain-containing radical SAM protein n=1 Tax=Fulvivirga ligni TaxID=2904246 RepID=UPI001F19956A|nr:radical SAM protein [Fulvivirga ligni]UII20469.1 radical SAM protein [Fulvivirga ligni]
MSQKVLFITPPFTQLNTPYPATAYLKGFLNTLNIQAHQADLGLDVILELFSRKGLESIFSQPFDEDEVSENAERIYRLRKHYLESIDAVIAFLQDKNPTLAYLIAEEDYLPEAARFEQLEDMEWAFGTLGIRDKARHLATLYLEDLGDYIKEVIDPHFGFSRYAERLGRSATSFDAMQEALSQPAGLIDQLMYQHLDAYIAEYEPTNIGFSVPFPGNLYAAFRCGAYIKKQYPQIALWLGGGYANTELRSLTEPRVFDYIDYVLLDDGEAPIQHLLEYLDGKRALDQLKRTFKCEGGEVKYFNGSTEKDVPQRETGTPDYQDLRLHEYLSVIEIANPMHRLWSDGRWNKLTLAHGCYWGKCTFCDISLDYIQRYEPLTAALLCDRIEEIIAQTGQNGFHFVDEAAPPALMRDLALEILRRNLTIVWWTNIRFEQSFTADLCRLLRASGCIAVSGGLEVASDRLLELIKKGVTVGQVARVTNHFTSAGIMVHAYLMYGFPTQTAQETIDSVEMVRQLFESGVLQSGFWHRFAMTTHSPVGLNPKAFGVVKVGPDMGSFANNDLYHDDPDGADHDVFGEGLRKSLFNYMHGIGFEVPVHQWFDAKLPKTTIPRQFIYREVNQDPDGEIKSRSRVVWIGDQPDFKFKGKACLVTFTHKKEDVVLDLDKELAMLVQELLQQVAVGNALKTVDQLGELASLLDSEIGDELREQGLLIL